jgi:TolB-like protein
VADDFQASDSKNSDLQFAHYRVLRRPDGSEWELGRGAMGVTYKAFDEQLRIDVALKLITPARVNDAKTQALLLREARAAARVRHPNVASVVFLSTTPGSLFYAMEFVAGEPLADRLRARGALPPQMAVGFAIQIARGLGAIHEQQIVHRDLKPANLMIVAAGGEKRRAESETNPDAWQIKIIDFGLARGFSGEGLGTVADAQTVGFRGTALYASPEQCEERGELDGRSDLYSLGCILWETLLGAPPFGARTHRELLNQHVALPAPLDRLAHLPPSLSVVLGRLLAKDPADRFADAEAVEKALQQCREHLESGHGLGEHAVITTHDAALAAPPNRSAPSSRKAVAVLPFANLSSDKENEYFADGIQEDVLTNLSRIRDLKVISRTSVMGYRGKTLNLREIARELGVGTVVEGSVRRSGNRIRVSAQLIDANSDEHLWAENFDSEMTDIFAIQTKIAQQIAQALEARLSPVEAVGLQTGRVENLAAYEIYRRGLAEFRRYRNEDNDRAIASFRDAIEKDPAYAKAHAALSEAYAYKVDKLDGPLYWLDSAIQSAERAVAIDPQSVEGYQALGTAYFRKGWFRRAVESLGKALELNPHSAEVLDRQGEIRQAAGDWVTAWEMVRQAVDLDPSDPYHRLRVGDLYFCLGEIESGESWMRRGMEHLHDPPKTQELEIRIAHSRGDFAGIPEMYQRRLASRMTEFEVSFGDLPMRAPVGYYAAMADWRMRKFPAVAMQVDEAMRMANPEGAQHRLILTGIAIVRRREGREAEMRDACRKIVQFSRQELDAGSESPATHFNFAIAAWLLGDRDLSDQQIDHAMQKGLLLGKTDQSDMMPETLLENPRFEAAFGEMNRKIEVQRAQIRELEKRYQ